MQLKYFLFLLLLVCATFVAINCEEDVDRRDVHRIILKPEKSKKHKKRPKPKSKPFKPHQPLSPLSIEDHFFEPSAHGTSGSPTRYQEHRQRLRNHYPNHHDEYHDLIKPKAPRHEDLFINYPEEDPGYYQDSASSNHQSYTPYQQNSDWNPIPSTQLTNDYQHHHNYPNGDDLSSSGTKLATTTSPKRNKRRKKPRRKATDAPNVTVTTMTTTTKPFPLTHNYQPQLQQHIPHQTQNVEFHQKSKKPQQHHYVNYNHNNKSHIKYEVSNTHTNPRGFPPTSPTKQHYDPDTKTSFSNLNNSFEVFEHAKDYNKQIKQTSFKGTLVPQPIYPQLPPFIPTVSTYTILEKSTKPTQLDFGKKNVMALAGLTKKLFY